MLESLPRITNILAAGDVSDELDFFVNNYLATERGLGLTACEPTLVELENIGQAIRFKIDSTYLDADSNEIKGYGNIGTDEGFVGEIYVSFDETNPEDIDVLFITPKEEIDAAVQNIMANADKFNAVVRPKGKY